MARTVSPSRWSEYDALLATAHTLGWRLMDLEQWILAEAPQGRILILRHDVDQNPASAIRMARIDARHDTRATWYFRWRTASPRAIARVVELGGAVGFHYETLTRLVRERGLDPGQIDDDLLAVAHGELRREVAAFNRHFGPIRSIAAHGDTRVPGVSNQVLMRGREPSSVGVGFDANEALSRHRLGLWMTDRSGPDGGWEHGAPAETVLRDATGPILCLTHPNNWCSGAALWADRLRAAALPRPPLNAAPWRIGVRTRGDRPPPDGAPLPAVVPMVAQPRLRTSRPVRSFTPVGQSLRREILRHYYDTGRSLTSESGLRTLETNSGLAEVRAATLEDLLARTLVGSLRDRSVLDAGCGFGALALVFASRGARVTALDPNSSRLEVGARVAREHGLPIRWRTGAMGETTLGDQEFDVVVMNNSLCYVVARAARRQALSDALAALRPGGVLVIRNPNRLRLFDQFTRLPLLAMLPPGLAAAAGRLARRDRSAVRLLSPGAARRELRRAGFADVQSVDPHGRRHLTTPFVAYQHLTARRAAR